MYSIQEIFDAIPNLKDNPLVQRVVEVFDEDESGGVDFKEFVLGKEVVMRSPQFFVKNNVVIKIEIDFSYYTRACSNMCWKWIDAELQ